VARTLVLAALAACALAALPAEAATKALPCSANGDTVTKNDSLRVYELSDSEGNHEYKACRLRTRERVTIYSYFSCECSTGDEPDLDRVVLAGHFVAVVVPPNYGPPGNTSPSEMLSSTIRVFDAAKRERVRTVSATPDDLVLRRQGSIAYRAGAELHVVPRTGTDTLVDAGPVQAGSLRLDGKRLSWISAGTPRSGTLD